MDQGVQTPAPVVENARWRYATNPQVGPDFRQNPDMLTSLRPHTIWAFGVPPLLNYLENRLRSRDDAKHLDLRLFF